MYWRLGALLLIAIAVGAIAEFRFGSGPAYDGKTIRGWTHVLRSRSVADKERALYSIIEIPFSYGYPSDLPYCLRRSLKEDASELYAAALQVAVRLDDRDKALIVPALGNVIQSGSFLEKERSILLALEAKGGDEASRKVIWSAAKDSESRVRLVAAGAMIARFGDYCEAEQLINRDWSDSDSEIKHALLRVIKHFAKRDVARAADLLVCLSYDAEESVRAGALDLVSRFDRLQPATRVIARGLSDPAARCRFATLSGLTFSKTWYPELEGKVRSLLDDESGLVRDMARIYLAETLKPALP